MTQTDTDKPTVLLVDDEPDILSLLELTLEKMQLASVKASNIAEAKEHLRENSCALCLTDMRLPDGDGIQLVDYIQQNYSNTPVAVITAHGNVETAIRALKNGAFDFLSKPVDLAGLRTLISSAIKLSNSANSTDRRSRHILLGDTPAMCQIRSTIVKLSRSQAPVYISGESGTGKELVARLIHQKSPRSNAPFIAVNCGAIPAELAESEFFGHLKGSFSGAIADKRGFFEAAAGGTLFLDEVAELPLSLQVKLLRALQEKHVRRIGDTAETPIDVRILSATHKELATLVKQEQFRQDLFYRINVIELKVPALRDRREDIPLLASHILKYISKQNQNPECKLTERTVTRLQSYTFPGNVRELENILERATALNETGIIEADELDLPGNNTPISETHAQLQTEHPAPTAVTKRQPDQPLESYMDEVEKHAIMQELERHRWNRTATARSLGITFRALRYRLKKLGVE